MSEQSLPALKDPINPPADPGMTAVQVHGGIITAQRVSVPRKEEDILKTAKFIAARAADHYYYRWPVKDKRGKTTYVEGPSIKLAMDLARIWGNCQVEPMVEVHPDHFMIYARFVDLETGYSLTRPFKQRRNLDLGRTDVDRADDIALQIGVSKALRNVIVGANSILAGEMLQAAKNSLVARIEKSPEKALEFIRQSLDKLDVDPERVARVYGRPLEKMAAPDLAKLYAEIQSVQDNMTTANDTWPTAAPEKEDKPAQVEDKSPAKKADDDAEAKKKEAAQKRAAARKKKAEEEAKAAAEEAPAEEPEPMPADDEPQFDPDSFEFND
jgi:hypothetical protein